MVFSYDGPIKAKLKNATGAILSPKDVRDYKVVCTAQVNFPEAFELELVRVKNQGTVGSCVAHALSEVVEYFNKVQNNDTTEMSVGYIYGNRETSFHKGPGMVTRDALKALKLYGDVPKEDFHWHHEVPLMLEKREEIGDSLHHIAYPYRISSYARLYSEKDIKQALTHNGPVVIAIDWYSDMKLDENNILITNKKNKSGGHCMVIYGWDETGWKVQNSWGKAWGNSGNCIIPYNMKLQEAWAVTDTIINDMEIKKPFSFSFGNFLAKILNWIINLF